MPDYTQVPRCLTSIGELSDAFAAEVAGLLPSAWDRLTNCQPWRVRDLATHVVVSGQAFVTSIRQGLAGSVEQVGVEDRRRRQAELEVADPITVAKALRDVTVEFVGLYDGLGPLRWARVAPGRHLTKARRGPGGCR
jgi:hypothetical protein